MTAVLHVFCQGVSRIQSENFIARSMPGSALLCAANRAAGRFWFQISPKQQPFANVVAKADEPAAIMCVSAPRVTNEYPSLLWRSPVSGSGHSSNGAARISRSVALAGTFECTRQNPSSQIELCAAGLRTQ
jgi:hypothetical protein